MNLTDLFQDIIPIVAIISVIFSTVLYINSRQRKSRDEARETRAELSYLRERIERQMYELNNKLYSDSSRWQEVNHLLLNKNDNEQLKASTKPFSYNFFENLGVNIEKINIQKDLVFFLTPFHTDYKEEFMYIEKICYDLGLKCSRGDEDFVKGNVLKYILEKILSSRIVIANLNGRNPNVYYELGIAHAVGKPVILISDTKSFESIPFDLQSNKLILYKNHQDLWKSLTNALAQSLIESDK